MTDKERLEEIKNSHLRGIHSLFGTPWVSMPKENLDWLLDRIEELEKEINKQMNIGLKFEGEANELQKQNKRYREALEFYADEEVYKENLITKAEYDADDICISNDEYAPPIIYFDRGEKARKALKGE